MYLKLVETFDPINPVWAPFNPVGPHFKALSSMYNGDLVECNITYMCIHIINCLRPSLKNQNLMLMLCKK